MPGAPSRISVEPAASSLGASGDRAHAKRTLAERCIDHLDDRIGNGGRVGLRRHDGGKRLLDLLAEAGIGTRFILRDAYRIVVNRSTKETWFTPDHYVTFYKLWRVTGR